MSSFIGHSLAGAAFYCALKKKQFFFEPQEKFWLIWLILIASSPDIDYIIKSLNSVHHHGIRITHSIFSVSLLPVLTVFILWLKKSSGLKQSVFQIFCAAQSHIFLDMLVGISKLPLFWPLSETVYKLPFGIFPSAGKIDFYNSYFYRNTAIEILIFGPILLCCWLYRHKKYKMLFPKIMPLLLISAAFMYVGFCLKR